MTEPTAADHRARVAVSTMFFVNGAALGGYVAHLPDFQRALHLTNGQLGRCMLFSALGAVTTMPLSGRTIHRFGSRNVTLFGGICLLMAAALLGFANTVPLLCAGLYFLGASNGQCDVGMNAHSMVVQDRYEKPVLSAIHGWFSLGGFAGGAGVAIAGRIGASPAQHLVTASLCLAILLAIGVSGMFPSTVDKSDESPKFALPSRRVVLLGVLVLFAFVSEGTLWDWCSVFLQQVQHSGPVIGSIGFGLASFAMAIGRFCGDSIIHRFGYALTLMLSALLSGGGILLAVNLDSLPLAIAGFAISGLGIANVIPILFRAGASVPGVSASMGLAAITTCGYTGFLAGPPIVGYVADHRTLSFSLGLIATLCLAIAAASRRATQDLSTQSRA